MGHKVGHRLRERSGGTLRRDSRNLGSISVLRVGRLTVIGAALAVVVVGAAVPAAVAHMALLALAPDPQFEVGQGVVGVASQVARLGRDQPT